MDDPSRNAPSDTERWDILRHKRSGTDRGAFPYRHAREDGGSGSDPAIVAYSDRSRIHDAVTTTLDVFIMTFSQNGHIGGDENAVANRNEAAVMDAKTGWERP